MGFEYQVYQDFALGLGFTVMLFGTVIVGIILLLTSWALYYRKTWALPLAKVASIAVLMVLTPMYLPTRGFLVSGVILWVQVAFTLFVLGAAGFGVILVFSPSFATHLVPADSTNPETDPGPNRPVPMDRDPREPSSRPLNSNR